MEAAGPDSDGSWEKVSAFPQFPEGPAAPGPVDVPPSPSAEVPAAEPLVPGLCSAIKAGKTGSIIEALRRYPGGLDSC